MGSSAYERTLLGIAIAVAAVWVIATLVQVAFPAHPVPVSVNAVMGIVATSFFGGAILVGRRNGSGSGPRPRQEDERPLIEAALDAAKRKRKGQGG